MNKQEQQTIANKLKKFCEENGIHGAVLLGRVLDKKCMHVFAVGCANSDKWVRESVTSALSLVSYSYNSPKDLPHMSPGQEILMMCCGTRNHLKPKRSIVMGK